MSDDVNRLPESLAPGFQLLVDEIALAQAAGAPGWHEMAPEELRAATRDIRKSDKPIRGVERREVEIRGADGSLPGRLYIPDGSEELGAGLIYFHGGGFTIGSIETHDSIVARLALSSGVKILSVDYRLAPDHRFPAAHDDAVASVRWVFDHAVSLGFAVDRIGIGGDSAGANLAASACLDLRADKQRQTRFLLLFYPNTTIAGAGGSRATYAHGHYLTLAAAHHLFRQYVDPHDATNPRIDLLNSPNLCGLPPTFLSVGRCDILFDECIAFVERLQDCGVPTTVRTYPGFIHGFYGFADRVPKVLEAFEEAGFALKAGLA